MMANTYTKLYFHIVFAVKHRSNLIAIKWKDELYKYISGIISNKNQKLIIINGMPDHIHLLIGMKPDNNLSDLIRNVKANSSRFINEKRWVMGKFEWQTGFGAFTVGYSQLDTVVNYIHTQELHHQKKSFREEYLEFLQQSEIDYQTEYIFDEV